VESLPQVILYGFYTLFARVSAEAVVVTAGKIVEEHSLLAVSLKWSGVNIKAVSDRISKRYKMLAKLVDD
jgi:hypothetical protein